MLKWLKMLGESLGAIERSPILKHQTYFTKVPYLRLICMERAYCIVTLCNVVVTYSTVLTTEQTISTLCHNGKKIACSTSWGMP